MKNYLKYLLVATSFSAPMIANASDFSWGKAIIEESKGNPLAVEKFEQHFYSMTGLLAKKNSLLHVFYAELYKYDYSQQELDLDHLRQVDIYLKRIPLSHSIYSRYSKGRIIEGLHILTAKYNIDEYKQGNSSYSRDFSNPKKALQYLNQLELDLLSALGFEMHISEENLRDHDTKLGLDPNANVFTPSWLR